MSSFFLFITANSKKRSLATMIIFCLTIFILFPYFIAFIWTQEDPVMKIFQTYFSFPVVYNSIAIFQLYPSILFGVIIIMLICNGFEENTFKILLINGISKKHLWKASILLCLILATILFILTVIITLNIGYIKSNHQFSFVDFYWLCIYYFQTFIFLLYAVLIALAFKHAGTATFIYLVYFLFAERWLAYIMDITFKLYPTCRFLPGKVVEDLTYMDPNPNFVIQYLEVQNLRWFFACSYLILSIILITFLFKKANYSK